MWALTLCPREARYCAENSRRFAPAQGRALRYWACTRRGGGLDAILSRALADWASYFGDGTLGQRSSLAVGPPSRVRKNLTQRCSFRVMPDSTVLPLVEY